VGRGVQPALRPRCPAHDLIDEVGARVVSALGELAARELLEILSFLVDGATKCLTTTSSVFVCGWRTTKVPVGTHTLTAVAVDSSDNRSRRSISVTVQR
jgi:hypothetical protein